MNDGDIKFTEELRAQAPRAALERLIERVETVLDHLAKGYAGMEAAELMLEDIVAEARKSL
jgi:hypothetical protein